MSFLFSPYEMGEESTSSTPIPLFTKGTFMLAKIAPPKSTLEQKKGIRDGLVATLAMLSYVNPATNASVPMIEVKQTTTGYSVDFPNGKSGLLCTKFRGPKNWYTFRNDTTDKKYIIGKNDPVTKVNSRCTIEAAEAVLSTRISDWDSMSQEDRDFQIDKYFEDFYMYGLAKDFNLPVETDPTAVPTIGMTTDFYREYTPPVGGEKYGRIVVTKYAPKHKVENLSSDYKLGDTAIAAAILDSITATNKVPAFDFTLPTENSVDEEPF